MALIGYLTLAYFVIGFIFSLLFAFRGSNNIDSNAAGSGNGFRFLIIPGATLLWPYLLQRWVGSKSA